MEIKRQKEKFEFVSGIFHLYCQSVQLINYFDISKITFVIYYKIY